VGCLVGEGAGDGVGDDLQGGLGQSGAAHRDVADGVVSQCEGRLGGDRAAVELGLVEEVGGGDLEEPRQADEQLVGGVVPPAGLQLPYAGAAGDLFIRVGQP